MWAETQRESRNAEGAEVEVEVEAEPEVEEPCNSDRPTLELLQRKKTWAAPSEAALPSHHWCEAP